MVDAALEKMMQNLDRYAEDLHKLIKKFDSVLLPESQAEAITAKAEDFSQIVSSLGV